MTCDGTFRRATLEDLETLVGFTLREARETEGEEPDPETARRGVRAAFEDDPPSTYWVAEAASGEVVGSVSIVTEWSNFRGGFYWWIQSLYIVPDHRGSGLVDRLLDFVVGEARKAGALDLRLYVLESNTRAVAAYRRCGFESVPYSIMKRSLE
jgi:ribosomal protein S18 acetylase RimI-like enzyme